MATLDVFIQDSFGVAKAVVAMGNPNSGYKEICFGRDSAKREVGEKGNQAVRDRLARALENCRVKNVHIFFTYCNLNQTSVQLLANAVKRNTCIGGFTCEQNPFNFPGGEYDSRTDEPVKQAIIASKARITMWNGKKLSQEMVEARKQRVALLKMIQALAEFKLDAETSTACALTLQKHGFDSLEKLAFVEESELAEAGIKDFFKRAVLDLKASLNDSKPVLRAQPPSDFTAGPMPPLPPGTQFYAFMSHDWGVHNVNHERVQGIVSAFSAKKWPMWLDDERLIGHDIATEIIGGIEASATFVLFITKAYVDRIESAKGKSTTDWDHLEFNYAGMSRRKTIVVVMEKEMLDQTKWKGPVGAKLGNMPCIDYTSEDKFELACSQLAKAIADKV